MDVRDPRLVSPRGNDVRVAIFSRIAACFEAHANDLQSARVGETIVLTVRDQDGIRCGAEMADADATIDRITLSASDDAPLSRERYDGGVLVERWVVRDLRPLP